MLKERFPAHIVLELRPRRLVAVGRLCFVERSALCVKGVERVKRVESFGADTVQQQSVRRRHHHPEAVI